MESSISHSLLLSMFSSAALLEFPFEEPTSSEGRQEKILLAAIIRRAAFDIALYKDSRRISERRIFIQAHRWMFLDSRPAQDSDRFVSFVNLCELLGQDPDVIRRKTMLLEKSSVKKFDRVGL